MRIGIDIRNIGKKRTGDEAVFLNLVKNLAMMDDQNEYLLFTDTDDITVLQYTVKNLGIENKKNFRIISLKTANKFTWNFWTLPNYLRKNKVDVYHTQYILPFFTPKNTKLITHIHDLSFNAYPQFIKWMDLFFLKTLIPRSLKKASKIIAISEFTKNEIIKYCQTPVEKIEVVYNAVGENFSLSPTLSQREREDVVKKYSLPDKFFLYIGTLQPRKNIPFLIQGFSKLKEKIPELKLVLVGQKNAHNFDREIDAKIKELNLQDDVIFPGYIESEDLPAIYKLADIFIFPSLYEGFGIPLLEAFAAGVPVCASNIPVFQEVAGKAAQYFNPEILDQLAEVVYNISINPELREKLTNSGQARSQLFSWAKSAQKMLEIYRSM